MDSNSEFTTTNGNDTSSAATPNDIVATATTNGATMERTCQNPDCNITSVMELLPKRKTGQFITDPVIAENPLHVDGFTTVFKINGSSAKLFDLKYSKNPNEPKKKLYRVMPNTHAHIVNYVVVETEGDSIRKINENDPTTMRKLLESQRASAKQMLGKLMGLPAETTYTTNTSVPAQSALNNLVPKSQFLPLTASVPATTALAKKPSVSLPTRMHPNLQITAVAGADSTMPIVTPSPTTNLQKSAADVAAEVQVPLASSAASHKSNDSPADIDKMKVELAELRRQVTLLAEAQAKSQQNDITSPPIKRRKQSANDS